MWNNNDILKKGLKLSVLLTVITINIKNNNNFIRQKKSVYF